MRQVANVYMTYTNLPPDLPSSPMFPFPFANSILDPFPLATKFHSRFKLPCLVIYTSPPPSSLRISKISCSYHASIIQPMPFIPIPRPCQNANIVTSTHPKRRFLFFLPLHSLPFHPSTSCRIRCTMYNTSSIILHILCVTLSSINHLDPSRRYSTHPHPHALVFPLPSIRNLWRTRTLAPPPEPHIHTEPTRPLPQVPHLLHHQTLSLFPPPLPLDVRNPIISVCRTTASFAP